ncbi:MAG: hypothetical protein D6677_11375 [Calditrichaeota bacterium]|nr:MAG: hypothetical protein D6677_11375 [Calditrichota bacterium]
MKKVAAFVVAFVFTLVITMSILDTAQTTISPKNGQTYSSIITLPPPWLDPNCKICKKKDGDN